MRHCHLLLSSHFTRADTVECVISRWSNFAAERKAEMRTRSKTKAGPLEDKPLSRTGNIALTRSIFIQQVGSRRLSPDPSITVNDRNGRLGSRLCCHRRCLNLACLHASPPNTSLIASSHFPLTHAHVAFAIATATACMVNCLCVAHAHVFVGCSNLSPH